VGEGARGTEARSHPGQAGVDAVGVGRRSRALPWEVCPPAMCYPGREVRGGVGRNQQRA
jgi:hypothetical protein